MVSNTEPVRIQKLLANAGLASRRIVEEMIEDKRIQVNGQIATLGDKACAKDEILVDGEPVILNTELVTYLLNKPKGVLSSASDDRGRQCVTDLIDTEVRLFPVGRLDMDTTGLILMSNDGDLTFKLTHPKFGVEKKYVAQVQGNVSQHEIEQLKNGVMLEDGMTSPAKVKVLAEKDDVTLLELIIHEGKNRQIRRMAEAIGHKVMSLHRSEIGPISDSSLEPGQYRLLSIEENHALYLASSQKITDS